MKDSTLQNKILSWFRENRRQLPWRSEKDWYKIWISEVMLQQTQVDTVIPYYHRFLEKFKTVRQLANASQQEVLKLWEGLGYYSRARNLHRAAQIIVSTYNSSLPTNREELLKIPGFGPYTSNAVLSIAFNQPFAVMDGNVKRVISRLYAMRDDIRDPKTQKNIQNLMDRMLPNKYPGEFNEAIMEIGATICKPSSPLCSNCPLSIDCLAYQKNLVAILPYKSPKPSIPSRTSVACIIVNQKQFLIAKRPQQEMLAGLWEFPILNINKGKNYVEDEADSIREFFNLQTTLVKSWPVIKHTYTHFHYRLHSKLYRSTSIEFKSDFYDSFLWGKIDDIKNLPLHKAMWKVLEKVESELVRISKSDIIDG